MEIEYFPELEMGQVNYDVSFFLKFNFDLKIKNTKILIIITIKKKLIKFL